MTTGILAFSFAKRSAHEEPNPVNINLAKATEKAVDHFRALGEDTVVVAQWEIARQLTYDNYRVDRTVTQHHASIKEDSKRYLNSDDVLREAQQLFGEREIKKVFVVANPFLHLPTIQKRVAAQGFTVIRDHKISSVGFDRDPRNLQWWCRGPVELGIYSAIQVVGKVIGHDFSGIGERTPDA